jgi:hypothetical protein
MAFVWNAYNILLLIASVLFGIGILFLGFKIVAPKTIDKFGSNQMKYQPISVGKDESMSSSSLSSSSSATSKENVRIGGSVKKS